MIASRKLVVMDLTFGVALVTIAVCSVAFVRSLTWWWLAAVAISGAMGVRDITNGVRQFRLRRANKVWIAATEDLRSRVWTMDLDAWYVSEDAGWIYYVYDPLSKTRPIMSLLLLVDVAHGRRQLMRARTEQFGEIDSALNLGEVAVLVTEMFVTYPGSVIMRHGVFGGRVIQGDDHELGIEGDSPPRRRDVHRQVKAIGESMKSGAGVATLDEVTEVLAHLDNARIIRKDGSR